MKQSEKDGRKTCDQVIALTILVILLSALFNIGAGGWSIAAPDVPPAQKIRIDGIAHFKRIDAGVYTGDMPEDSGLRSLARAQVKTVICLTGDVPYGKIAKDLNLRVEHIALSSFKAPDPAAVMRFLEVVTDPSAKPVFFHGREREGGTSAMAAIYRIQVQGWPQDKAVDEVKESVISALFVDLKAFASSYRQILQKHPSAIDMATRLDRARAQAKAGRTAQALADAREAMIRAASVDERIAVAGATIQILDTISSKGELPAFGLDIAEREWTVLEIAGAEDTLSLISLGNIFQRGLNLSRSLEAFDRAQARGKEPIKELTGQVQRVRTVRSYAPRSPLGKQLGLKTRINRGELAALLMQELRVDRLRTEHAPATWQSLPDANNVKLAAGDIAGTPYDADIQNVLNMGIRGLELFSDGTFRPEAFVSRAEFVVVIEDILTRATRDSTLPTQLLGKTPRYTDVPAGAWYQSAADLARGLGLFAPAPGAEQTFNPLIDVTGVETLGAFRLLKKNLDLRSRVIIVVVDALRAESVYTGIDRGRLPNLARLIDERGVVRVERCLSALPSVTLPNHTTIFTGVYPGRHAVPGNEWFDRSLSNDEPLYRRTREYVKYGTEDDPGLGRAWSFGGIPVHDMDLSPSVRTVYEAFKAAENRKGRKAKTAVVFDPVRRGADCIVNPDVFDALISLDILPFVNDYALMDQSTMKKTVELIRSDDPPELLGVWLSGLDGWSHAHGPGPVGTQNDRQSGYVEKYIDPLMGDLAKALAARGILDETMIFLVSDHGQADTAGDAKYAVDAEKVYQAMAKSPYRPPLDKEGHLDNRASDFDIAVMANSNGNAALVSIRTPGAAWKAAPRPADIEAVAGILIAQPYVSRIFFIEPSTTGRELTAYALTAGASGPVKNRLLRESEEMLIVRTMGIAGSSRSGDLLVEARYPYYFSPAGTLYRGQHGRRESLEDHVPLLMLNPSGGRKHIVKTVTEIADIAPTVAGVLGFLEELPADGKDLLDPPRIIVSSHTEDQVVETGKTVGILGFVRDAVGVVRVEYRVGDEGNFIAARGTSTWDAEVTLNRGRHAIVVRATDETGLRSQIRFHLVAR